MAQGSGATVTIEEARLPFLKEAASLVQKGCVTGASHRNWTSYGEHVALPEGCDDWRRHLLTDPQTSGGLLVACAAERADEIAARIVQQLVRRLRDAEDQIEIMMLTDTQSKVVSALLKLAQQARDQGGGGPVTAFTISPMELSTRVGVDVDTVKRAVQQLREGQYVRVTDERLEIPDLEALRRLYALLGVKDELRGDSE
jgi:hypothetical protein